MTSAPITIEEIVEYVQHTFPGIYDDYNWGERALFYNPGRQLPKGIYFLTFKEKDGANDSASQIREGEYRLNIGISRQAFIERFSRIPSRPAAGCIVDSGHDFTLTDVITPHPVYGWMSWIAIKNPSQESFGEIKLLLTESYKLAVSKHKKRIVPANRII